MDGRKGLAAFLTLVCLPLGLPAAASAQEFLEGSLFSLPAARPAAPGATETQSAPRAQAAPSTVDLITAPTASNPEAWTEYGKPTQAADGKSSVLDCCRLCPCAYGVVEALILERNISGTPIPLAVDATSGATLLSTNDLDFPFSGGLRAYVGHRFCGCWAWELGYFGLFDATASTSITGDLALPDDLGPGTNVFFGADRFDLDYTSRIHGGEFNFVCCCSCCEPCCVPKCSSREWIYGFRYLRVDEKLDIFAERLEVGGLETGSYAVRTSNDLYGPQFGLRLRHCRGPWSVEGTGKLGLFYNDANMSQTVTDFPTFVLRQTSSSDSDVALVGELNLSLIRQLSDHWFVRGGYNLIWIDGVALAPDQLDFSLTSTSGTTIDDDNTMFLHGLNLGVEARW